jgi:chromate transporter
VLAYVAQEAVGTYGWLAPGEMLDGLGMAETTPGPLIMVTQFVGFMGAYREAEALSPVLAGALGGLLTTWVTFAPCFAWILLGAPYIEGLRSNRALSAALAAVTAAVVGVILNLALWFALHVVFAEVRIFEGAGLRLDVPALASIDPAAALLSAAAIIAVFRLRLGMLAVLGGAAAIGILLHLAGLA